jgi:hypothetical protein
MNTENKKPIKTFSINQELYIVFEGTNELVKKNIVSAYLSTDKTKIEIAIALLDYNNNHARLTYFIDRDEAIGGYDPNYNNSKKFRAFDNQTQAIEYGRSQVLLKSKELRGKVETAFKNLKEYREKYYELLYTEDENKWLEAFVREHQW